MKAKFLSLAMLALTLAFGLAMTGCKTAGALYEVNSVVGDFQTIKVPAKDFTSLGIVLAEGVISLNQGEVYTYYALLKEAQKLGADAIVNVTMSKKLRQGSTDEVWYGAATAIKYVDGLIRETSVTIREDGVTITTETILMSAGDGSLSPDDVSNILIGSNASKSTSSEKKWYKPSTWFKKT